MTVLKFRPIQIRIFICVTKHGTKDNHTILEVTSLENDYAGYPNKPIQGLSISAYSKDGTKLTASVVVMYRAYVDGRWLPWVSNADPEWMQDVQENYNLGGTLDVSSSYAGIIGKNISGVEILCV